MASNTLKLVLQKASQKQLDKIAEEAKLMIDLKTPVDTRKLKNSLTIKKTSPTSRLIEFENVEYAGDVEFGKGTVMTYHLEDGTTFNDIGAGMIRKTADEIRVKYKGTLKSD